MRKMSIYRFLLAGFLAFVVPIGVASSQSGKNKMLDVKIPAFQVTSAPTSLVLQRLASSSNIPMGIEAVPENAKPIRTIDINLKGATIRSILAHVAEKDPEYTWKQAGSVINVFPRQDRDPFLEIIVERFVVNNVNKEEALRALQDSHEVKRILTREHLRNRTLKTLPGDSEYGLPRLSISLKRSSVRNILNAIMLKSESKSWLFFRHGPLAQSFSLTIR